MGAMVNFQTNNYMTLFAEYVDTDKIVCLSTVHVDSLLAYPEGETSCVSLTTYDIDAMRLLSEDLDAITLHVVEVDKERDEFRADRIVATIWDMKLISQSLPDATTGGRIDAHSMIELTVDYECKAKLRLGNLHGQKA
jgi:hypothetical protein